MTGKNKLSNKMEIQMFIHCGLCIDEYKNTPEINTKMSPKEYSRIQAGWTVKGLQIWCNRHNCNVMNIDFEGQHHPANVTIQKKIHR